MRYVPSGATLLDEARELARARDADVEVAVGGEDDAVVAFAHEILLRDVVGELDPRAAGGRPACLETIDRVEDRGFVAPGRGRQHETGVARVDDDRDAVLRTELIDEKRECLLHEWKLLGHVHRPRDVDQEYEIARRQTRRFDAPRLKTNANDAVRRIPRRGDDIGRDRDRVFALRPGVVIREIVDQLFDANRILGRHRSTVDEPTDVGVRRAVNVHRECRERIGRDGEKRVVLDPSVFLGVERGGVSRSRCGATRHVRPCHRRRRGGRIADLGDAEPNFRALRDGAERGDDDFLK